MTATSANPRSLLVRFSVFDRHHGEEQPAYAPGGVDRLDF